MPPLIDVYRGYRIPRVRWNDDWHPDRCNTCRVAMNGSSYSHFYDVQNHNCDLVNEDAAYCSGACARAEIDRLIAENGPLLDWQGNAITDTYDRTAEEMQEEETEE